MSLYGLGLTLCSAERPDRAPASFSSTSTSFLWLHVDFSLTAHGRQPAEAAAAELHAVLVNWQFVLGFFFFCSTLICSTMHIFLNVSCSIGFLLLLLLFVSKCPLIGCTVTVLCFQRPLWQLKVAYLTPAPRSETPSSGGQSQPAVSFSYGTFSTLAQGPCAKLRFQKALASRAPSEAKSAWFQHLLIIRTYGPCLHERLPASVSHLCQHADIPPPSGRGERPGAGAPGDPGPFHRTDPVGASPRSRLGCISASEGPGRTVIPTWGRTASPHFNPLPFQPQWETCAGPADAGHRAHRGRGCLPSQ